MIRYGHSWPAGYGGRSWVSGPLWLWPFGCLGYGVWWVMAGWWLTLLWLAIATAAWAVIQVLLILASLAFTGLMLWQRRHGRHYRPVLIWAWHHWLVLDWVRTA